MHTYIHIRVCVCACVCIYFKIFSSIEKVRKIYVVLAEFNQKA